MELTIYYFYDRQRHLVAKRCKFTEIPQSGIQPAGHIMANDLMCLIHMILISI